MLQKLLTTPQVAASLGIKQHTFRHHIRIGKPMIKPFAKLPDGTYLFWEEDVDKAKAELSSKRNQAELNEQAA